MTLCIWKLLVSIVHIMVIKIRFSISSFMCATVLLILYTSENFSIWRSGSWAKFLSFIPSFLVPTSIFHLKCLLCHKISMFCKNLVINAYSIFCCSFLWVFLPNNSLLKLLPQSSCNQCKYLIKYLHASCFFKSNWRLCEYS